MAPQPFLYFLKWVAHYHKGLQAHYDKESKKSHRPEVNALLTYLSQNEALLAELIDTYEHDAPDALLNAWFKIAPNLINIERPNTVRFDPEMTIGEAIDRVLVVDSQLRAIFEMLLRQANSQEMREALEDLIREEHREEMRLMACEGLGMSAHQV